MPILPLPLGKHEKGEKGFLRLKPHVMDNSKIYNGTQPKALALLSLLGFATLTSTADHDQGQGPELWPNLGEIRGRG